MPFKWNGITSNFDLTDSAPSGAGDVFHTDPLTLNKIVVGAGTDFVKVTGINIDGLQNITNINTLAVTDVTTTQQNLDLEPGVDVQVWNAELDGISAIGGTGIAVRLGAGSWTTRAIDKTDNFTTVLNANGVAGNPQIGIDVPFETTGMHGWNGSVLETVDIGVTSDGATITFSAEKSGGGNLIVVFSDGYHPWDTSPADTITLTAGSDTVPMLNYVYFLQTTKLLTVSTAGWPATEHAPLATVLCQSASTLQTNLAMKNHGWTDHLLGTNNQGHLHDINFWIRSQQATYVSGMLQTYDINSVTDPDEVTISTVAGKALQLHEHAVPIFSASDDYYVINDSVTPYKIINDLNEITADSTGATLTNRFYSLVMWIAVNQETAECKRFINLPNGSYGTQSGVETDSDDFANYSIPNDFVGTGILISEWKLRRQSGASGTFTSIEEIDLRGLLPSLTAGGGSGVPTEFPDNTFRIYDDGDDTRKIAFQADQITTATVRTITMRDSDLDLADVVEGPAVAVNLNLASFNGVTGKLIADSGIPFGTVLVDGDIGVTIQAYSANLDDFAGLTPVTGDIIYSDGSPSWVKLPKAVDGKILKLVAGFPSWQDDASGGDVFGPGSSTTGNMATYGDGTGKLIADSGIPSSTILVDADIGVTIQAYSANLDDFAGLTPVTGDIIYSDGSPTWVKLPKAVDGKVLKLSSGFPSWQDDTTAMSWTDVTGTSQAIVANNGYVANNVSLVTATLPLTCSFGDTFWIVGKGTGGWRVAQNAGQTIHHGNIDTTTGITGRLDSTHRYDRVQLLCTTTDTDFTVLSGDAIITVT